MMKSNAKLEIKVKYYAVLGRASGLFRMMEEARVPYEHVKFELNFGCALSSDDIDTESSSTTTTNLEPPVIEVRMIEEGDPQGSQENPPFVLSQAIPCHQYLGKLLGFDHGIGEDSGKLLGRLLGFDGGNGVNVVGGAGGEVPPEIALQFMMDLHDLHEEMQKEVLKGDANNNIEALQKYLQGKRYRKHLQTINRCIKGPFYFGSTPTYVDYATTSYLDMMEGKWLIPLLEKTEGDTIQRYAPKLRSVVSYIRSLPSAKQLNTKIPLNPSHLVLSPQRVATWQKSLSMSISSDASDTSNNNSNHSSSGKRKR